MYHKLYNLFFPNFACLSLQKYLLIKDMTSKVIQQKELVHVLFIYLIYGQFPKKDMTCVPEKVHKIEVQALRYLI